MNERDEQERAKDLAGLWQGSVMPVEDEENADARRARVVPRLGDAILRARARRQRDRVLRRFGMALAAAASVLLALGLGRYVGRAKERSVTASMHAMSGVRAMAGAVTLVRGAQSRAVDRASLETGDSVSTGPNATAEVRLTDLVVARLGESSEVALVTPRASAHRLRLDRGEIRAQVDDRPSPTPKLVVETPNVEVVVTGTIFEVVVAPGTEGAESTTVVSVTKGRIVVRRDGAEIAAVTAGQRWSSVVAPRAEQAPAPAVASSAAPLPALSAPVPTTAPHREPLTRLDAAPHVAAPTADDSSGTLAEENRLFQAAIESKNQGNDYGAITRLTELLSRYPSAPLAAEARVERMRALRRTGHVMEAAREAKLYLADYPGGFAAEEARALVAQVESN